MSFPIRPEYSFLRNISDCSSLCTNLSQECVLFELRGDFQASYKKWMNLHTFITNSLSAFKKNFPDKFSVSKHSLPRNEFDQLQSILHRDRQASKRAHYCYEQLINLKLGGSSAREVNHQVLIQSQAYSQKPLPVTQPQPYKSQIDINTQHQYQYRKEQFQLLSTKDSLATDSGFVSTAASTIYLNHESRDLPNNQKQTYNNINSNNNSFGDNDDNSEAASGNTSPIHSEIMSLTTDKSPVHTAFNEDGNRKIKQDFNAQVDQNYNMNRSYNANYNSCQNSYANLSNIPNTNANNNIISPKLQTKPSLLMRRIPKVAASSTLNLSNNYTIKSPPNKKILSPAESVSPISNSRRQLVPKNLFSPSAKIVAVPVTRDLFYEENDYGHEVLGHENGPFIKPVTTDSTTSQQLKKPIYDLKELRSALNTTHSNQYSQDPKLNEADAYREQTKHQLTKSSSEGQLLNSLPLRLRRPTVGEAMGPYNTNDSVVSFATTQRFSISDIEDDFDITSDWNSSDCNTRESSSSSNTNADSEGSYCSTKFTKYSKIQVNERVLNNTQPSTQQLKQFMNELKIEKELDDATISTDMETLTTPTREFLAVPDLGSSISISNVLASSAESYTSSRYSDDGLKTENGLAEGSFKEKKIVEEGIMKEKDTLEQAILKDRSKIDLVAKDDEEQIISKFKNTIDKKSPEQENKALSSSITEELRQLVANQIMKELSAPSKDVTFTPSTIRLTDADSDVSSKSNYTLDVQYDGTQTAHNPIPTVFNLNKSKVNVDKHKVKVEPKIPSLSLQAPKLSEKTLSKGSPLKNTITKPETGVGYSRAASIQKPSFQKATNHAKQTKIEELKATINIPDNKTISQTGERKLVFGNASSKPSPSDAFKSNMPKFQATSPTMSYNMNGAASPAVSFFSTNPFSPSMISPTNNKLPLIPSQKEPHRNATQRKPHSKSRGGSSSPPATSPGEISKKKQLKEHIERVLTECETDPFADDVDEKSCRAILNYALHGDLKTSWNDIAGLSVIKKTLKEELIFPFLRPDLFNGLSDPVKSLLLFGPSGNGKSMLAKALGKESKCMPFVVDAAVLIAGLSSKESEKLIRSLFYLAKKLAPLIVIVDNIEVLLEKKYDTVKAKAVFEKEWRGLIMSELNHHQNSRTNQKANFNDMKVLLIGTTSRPWAMDESSKTFFSIKQYIPLPDFDSRKALVKKLVQELQNHKLGDVDFRILSTMTNGYTGAEIIKMTRQAAMGPLRELGDNLLSVNKSSIRAVEMLDFKVALKSLLKSTNVEIIQKFEKWSSKHL